jgi:kojibiose phosphorylase
MNNFYSRYTDDDLWIIKETEWAKSLQNIRESQFALGNGYVGSRAVLEEIPYGAMPGTYLAGIYDKMAAQVSTLVNLPNPFNFRFSVNGEKLGVVAMDVLGHKRMLNMKKGLLIRHSVYRDSKKQRYDYHSLRFVSMHNKNIGVMQIAITPLDSDCEMDINTGIDTAVYNTGVLWEGNKKHFRLIELGQRGLGQRGNAGYLAIETFEKKHIVIYWAGFYYEIGQKKTFTKDNIFRLKLKKRQTIIFTKIFFVKHFSLVKNLSRCKNETFAKFRNIFHLDFEDIIGRHIKTWEKLWHKADILIEGTQSLQQNLRFNIYHMLICANYDRGFSSIGARTLTGEGYRGHIFWDAEIFLMPFYLFTFPEVAKNMLLYRYKRLDKAREIAQRGSYKGAQFPWESADTGEEETPSWARDIDGTIVKIHTHEMEQHITADIAYAVYKYYVVTGDEEFMKDYGYEILFETARFWASRLEYNKKKRKYEIKHIIGPDEFHIDVNNNAYTNMMAKWNLIAASKMFYKIKKQSPTVYKRLRKKINLRDKEVSGWRKIAFLISFNVRKDGLIEEFVGYLKLKKIILKRTDENGIPLLPSNLKAKDLGKTQLVKQADVVMLLVLLRDVFNLRTKEINYNFYIQRTVHKSSLSPSIHSVIASECGDLNKAYNLFNVALRTDIGNLYGNTKEGIHSACLGGVWQAVIFGFGGLSVEKEKLYISPRMPRSWRKMIFCLYWKKDLIKFELKNEAIRLKIISKIRKRAEIRIFGKKCILKTNKVYSLEKKAIQPSLEYGYY